MFCLNVRNRNSVEMLHHGGEYYVSHTEFDVTKLRYHTDESVRDIARDLQVRSNIESKTRFTLTQKQFGFTHNPGSILLDDRLVAIYKPISATVFDWMHVLLIDGVFAIHMGCLMARLKEFAVTCATLHTFVKNWHWPGRINSRGVSGKDLCDPKHDAKWYELEKFKPSASEVLSLYPVFALFFATLALPGELCRPEITCFLLLCDVHGGRFHVGGPRQDDRRKAARRDRQVLDVVQGSPRRRVHGSEVPLAPSLRLAVYETRNSDCVFRARAQAQDAQALRSRDQEHK